MSRTATRSMLALLLAGVPLPTLALDGPAAATSSVPNARLAPRAASSLAASLSVQRALTDAPTGEDRQAAQTPASTQATTLEAKAASAAATERPDEKPDEQPAGPPTPAPAVLPVSSGAEVGFYSEYLWRGLVLADAFSMQPTYWVKFVDSLTVSSWMNVSREQAEGPLTEHDLTVDYTKVVKEKWAVSGGWINYVFPGLDEGSVTNEVYAGLAHASWLNPAVKVFVDVHEGDGTYVNFSVNHSFPVGPSGFAATPSFGISYNHEQWIDGSTWSDANFGLKLTVPTPIKRLFLTPAIYYSKSLNDDFYDDHFYGGIGIVTKLF
jgi:Bacterial protein of unknown function (Gcw_chp)